jgi:deazaflavin-dependent oxidoreductase (nitroreductase family)
MDTKIQDALGRGGTINITTVGRRSGEPRRIEIVFHNIGGRLYISGMPSRRRRSWLANLASTPTLTFHLVRPVRADLPARARILDDAAERRQVLTQVAKNWKRNDVDTMVEYSPLIEVTLEDQAA